ncbi:DUF6438 domain-containing protein [Hyphococcus sp.]|uniref:DUF6438 domain-containing protein n=1 Tax=Hyphococcus sp. TaxID=2038636 RepID=UPI00207F9AF2|nr:MAG: hypothetical protein DHS20C04_16130 [Marinicaulis sp.]
MRFTMVVGLILAALAGACSTQGYTPYYATPGVQNPNAPKHDQFTLQRTACFGFCPVYKVSVDDRDLLVFEGERFVAEAGGAVSKRLPDGAFNRLVAIAKSHDFASYDAAYPNEDGSNCAQMATDMPSVSISFNGKKLSHAVRLYQGCFGMDGREQFDEMLTELDAVLDIDDLIGPREDFYGAKE